MQLHTPYTHHTTQCSPAMPHATTATSINQPRARAPRALLVLLLLLSLLLVLMPSGANAAAAVEDEVEGGPLVATNLTFHFAGKFIQHPPFSI